MPPNLLRLARDLQRRKARRRRRLALAEGARLVRDALDAGVSVRGVLIAPAFEASPLGDELLSTLMDRAIAVTRVPPRALAQAAETDTPQGIVAIVELPRWPLEALTPEPAQPVIVLDRVQDPGNVGALFRTAFALGAKGAVLLRGTADPANPKVLRASMGACFRLPIAALSDAEFASWVAGIEAEVWVAATGGTPLSRVGRAERVALVFGNEGAGVRPAVRALARRTVAIPLARGAESLNVAVAAGILLYELQHGRR